MRAPMYLPAVLVAVLAACSGDSGTTTGPDTTSVKRAGFYVSVDGSQTGDGSSAHPWALSTALAQPAAVKPGDTIWIHGGTYKGDVVSKLTGTVDAPVVLRQYPGERATIDGRIDVDGQYAYYWGFEVIDSDVQRTTTTAGSRPADLPRNLVTVYVSGPFNKLINLVIHDLGDGIYSGSDAEGLEVYGTLIYNNGWIGPDRGHGHGIYLQNQFSTKHIVDNVVFNNFSTGLKIGGSAAAYLLNFEVTGNSIFTAGGPAISTYPWQFNAQSQGGGSNRGNLTFSNNSFYHIDPNYGSVALGDLLDSAALYPLDFQNNTVQGMSDFAEWQKATVRGNKFTSGPTPIQNSGARLMVARIPGGVATSAYDWDANSYAYSPSSIGAFYKTDSGVATGYTTLDAWHAGTGWDGASSFITGAFPGIDVLLRANRYEPGRATVTVWNWTNAATANIDPSSVLKSGDKYTVRHVYDYYGQPIEAGTYSGTPISVPLRAYTAPIPIGMTAPPPSTGVEFNVFIIQKS